MSTLAILIAVNILFLFVFHNPENIINYLINFNMNNETLKLITYLGKTPISGVTVY